MKITSSNINFGSYYKFNATYSNSEKVFDAEDKILNLQFRNPNIECYNIDKKITPDCDIFSTRYVKCPDNYDSKIEKILSNYGINFKKTSTKDTLSRDGIISRIALSEYDKYLGRKLVFVNTEKLEELFKKDIYYIGYSSNRSDFEPIKKHIKAGLPISASTVFIKKNEQNEPTVSFQDGRHRYCILKELGAKSIPISLDEDSIALAKELNMIDKIID